MRLEIESLKSKNQEANSSEESESDEGEDDEVKLNFSNLKKIDRKSCSIVVPGGHGRKSTVTISGDSAVVYEAPEDEEADKGSNKAISGK